MRHVNNYFIESKESGSFAIESGVIRPMDGIYQAGQYVRIVGGVLNRDSVVQIERIGDGYIDVSIHDEDFSAWQAPTGAHDAYMTGDRVTHNNVRYVSLIDFNTTVPGAGRYWEVVGMAEHYLRDETFTGAICGLAVPPDFLELVSEIRAFQETAAKNPNTGVVSESFGGYAYSMATGANGMPATWKEAFASRLNPYRKMWDEVIL